MLEKNLQKRMSGLLKKNGWFVRKVEAVGNAGLPDLLLLRDGEVTFVEVKTTQGRLSARQVLVIDEINRSGGRALVWYGLGDCVAFIEGGGI